MSQHNFLKFLFFFFFFTKIGFLTLPLLPCQITSFRTT